MKILEVCVELDGGGIDRYLYNYCTKIKDVQFDFVVVDEGSKKGMLEDSIKSLGSNIFRVSPLRNGLRRNYNQLLSIMKCGNYDAVHSHLGYKSFVALKCAKECGIKTRIAHAHISFEPESFLKKIIRRICTKRTIRYSTNLVACGIKAAKWVWGESAFKNGLVTIHNNAIPTDLFAFNKNERDYYRQKFNLADGLVFGNVGRIGPQKNQIRLISIFNEIHKINKNVSLLLIGSDETNGECKKAVDEFGLQASVHFLGVRDDVNRLFNAFDCFIFPSVYEGLPFTLIEAECNGVPILYSESITEEVLFNCNVLRMSLNLSDKEWAIAALKVTELGRDDNGRLNVISHGYDLNIESKKLNDFYINEVKKNDCE